jgi:hypothetical protein
MQPFLKKGNNRYITIIKFGLGNLNCITFKTIETMDKDAIEKQLQELGKTEISTEEIKQAYLVPLLSTRVTGWLGCCSYYFPSSLFLAYCWKCTSTYMALRIVSPVTGLPKWPRTVMPPRSPG